MNTAIPTAIQPLLDEYQARLARDVPELVEACYLCGSLALGAFNERRSDIDFVALLRRPPTTEEIAALGAIHRALAVHYPRCPLEGSYLHWHDLGRLPDAVAPYPHVAQGTFHPSGHYDLNLVTWWILKQHGIALCGPAAQTLPFEVDLSELLARMHENLHSYWQSWTRQPSRMARLLSDDGFQWAVLGVLRLWYTFREHAITSKTGAGRYALEHIPARWHRLIREAIAVREGSSRSSQSNLVRTKNQACPERSRREPRTTASGAGSRWTYGGLRYTSRMYRAYEAVQFLKYVIQACDDL